MAGCDNDSCSVELAGLPLLAGCPADSEWILVGNAVGGSGKNGYARRRWSDIKSCAGGGMTFNKLQFEVGVTPSAPILDGSTDLVITVNNPVADSEIVVLDNSVLEPNLSDQISYTISYSTTEIIITFNQAVSNGQKYYIKYATT